MDRFYLLYPLLLHLCYPSTRMGWVLIVIVFLGSAACSLLWQLKVAVHRPEFAFYLLPSRAWELLSGVSLSLMPSGWTYGWSRMLSLVGGILMVLSFVLTRPYPFPIPWGLLPVLATVAFIAAGKDNPHLPCSLNALLSTEPFVYAGRLSYALYLWHWPVIVIARWSIGLGCWAIRAMVLLVSIALAAASHHMIEQPLMQWHRKMVKLQPLLEHDEQASMPAATKLTTASTDPASSMDDSAIRKGGRSTTRFKLPRPESALAPGLLVLVGVVAGIFAVLLGPLFGKLYLGAHVEDSGMGMDVPFIGRQCSLNSSLPSVASAYDRYPTNPCYSRNAFQAWRRHSLQSGFQHRSGNTGRSNPYQPPVRNAGERLLLLLGDSHAFNYAPSMEAALGDQMRIMTNWVWLPGLTFCPYALSGSQMSGSPPNRTADVAAAMAFIAKHLRPAGLQPGDIVLHASWQHDVPDKGAHWLGFHTRLHDPLVLERHLAQLDVLYKAVVKTGAALILTGDVPLLQGAGSTCATSLSTQWRAWCPLSCSRSLADSHVDLEPVNTALKKFASTRRGVYFYTIHDLLCEGEGCGPFIPGTDILAWNDDSNHITQEASFSTWPHTYNFLRQHGLWSHIDGRRRASVGQHGRRKGRSGTLRRAQGRGGSMRSKKPPARLAISTSRTHTNESLAMTDRPAVSV